MATPEEQYGQILALLNANQKGIAELESMSEMKVAKADLDAWRPTVDHRVAGLEQAIHDLGDCVELLFAGNTSPEKKEAHIEHPAPDHTTAGNLLMPGSAHLEPTPCGATSGPCGHRQEDHHRSVGHGMVYATLDPPPVTSAKNLHQLTPTPFNFDGSASRDHVCQPFPASAIPQFSFPKFDGSNPRLWVTQCETYFDVYATHHHLWVKIATMNLVGLLHVGFSLVVLLSLL